MKKKSRIIETLLLILTILPLVCGIMIKVFTYEPSNGIEITGAKIFFTLDTALGQIPITE